MPIYEYECLKCSKTFEVMQKFSDPDVNECRFCGAEVRRLLSPPAVIFKGSGWYVSDFPNADRKKGMEAEKAAAGNSSKDKKTDTCPANCSKKDSCPA